MKGDAFVYVAMITMKKKLANGHMAPLCGTSGSHSAAGIVSVSSIQWLGDLANEFAMVSSI